MAKKKSKKKVTKKKVTTKLKRKILPVFSTPKRNKAADTVTRKFTKKDINAAKQLGVDRIECDPNCKKPKGHDGLCFDDDKPRSEVQKVTDPGNGFPLWPDAKCGTCGHDASNDPNGECYAYLLTCPVCGREGCDECMPLGRGIACPDCENSEEHEVP